MTCSTELRPTQDATEAIEIRLALPEFFEQSLSVTVDKCGKEVGRQPGAVGREQRSHHPLDDVGRRREFVTVDLHADDLLLGAEFVEEVGVRLGRKHETTPVARYVSVERIDIGSFVRHLKREEM